MLDKEINRERLKFSIPHFPANLPGSFWGMTTFYNPCRYKRRVENYKRFRAASAKQGLKLLCVELAFGNSGYELSPGDAEIMVRLRTKDVLWQKERLLNIGLTHLPDDCDKIAWLDADLVFCNDHWIEETSHLLKDYVAVQLFSSLIRLPKDVYDIDHRTWPLGRSEGCKINSDAYEVVLSGGTAILATLLSGVPGGAWASRRGVFDRCGFYDRDILGYGDSVLAYALYGKSWPYTDKFCSAAMISDRNRWIQIIYKEVQGSVLYTKGEIAHLWHGDFADRMHNTRGEFLKESEFDPGVDIKLDQNDCWQWATFKPVLHLYTQLYFYLRNEDGTVWGTFLKRIVLFLFYVLRVTTQCADYLKDFKKSQKRPMDERENSRVR